MPAVMPVAMASAAVAAATCLLGKAKRTAIPVEDVRSPQNQSLEPETYFSNHPQFSIEKVYLTPPNQLRTSYMSNRNEELSLMHSTSIKLYQRYCEGSSTRSAPTPAS